MVVYDGLDVETEFSAESSEEGFGQQTPGTKRLLKHNDCLRLPKLSRSWGQSLKSLQYLKTACKSE